MNIVDIAFFSYPVIDLRRARRYYEGTLGLVPARSFGGEDQGTVEYDIGAGTLCIANVFSALHPSSGGGTLVLEVADFDAAVATLRRDYVSLVFEPYESPMCRGVAFSDPDRNSLMIHQRKKADS